MRLHRAVLLLLLVLGTLAALHFIPRRTRIGAGGGQRPDPVATAVAQGQGLARSGSLRAAERAYRTALQLAPDRQARHATVDGVREFLGGADSLPGGPLRYAELTASLWLAAACMDRGDSHAARQGLDFYLRQAKAFETAAHCRLLVEKADQVLGAVREDLFATRCRVWGVAMAQEYGQRLDTDEVTWLSRALAICRTNWPDDPEIAYLRGLALLGNAEQARGTRAGRALLAEAQGVVADFAAQHPESDAAAVYRAAVAQRCLLASGRVLASEEVLADLAALQERVTPDVEPAVAILFARLLAAADCRPVSPDDSSVVLGVRRALAFLRDSARARPAHWGLKLELAQLLGPGGRREQAIAELEVLTAVVPRLSPNTVEHEAARFRACIGRMLTSDARATKEGAAEGGLPGPTSAGAWEAVSQEPRLAPFLKRLEGLRALRTGDPRKAASLLVKANRELGGRDPAALLSAGLALLECHEYGASADLLRRALRCPRLAGPDRVRAAMALVEAGLRAHDTESASSLVRGLRELSPGDRRVLLLAADALTAGYRLQERLLDDEDAADVASLERGLVRLAARGDLAAVHWLSHLQRARGRSHEALSLLRVHAGTAPSDPRVLIPLLELEVEAAAGGPTAERLRRALAVLQDTPARDVLLELTSEVPAVPSLTASLIGLAQLDSELDACLGLVDRFQRNGRTSRAEAALRRAAALAPTDPRILSRQIHRGLAAGETALASDLIAQGRDAGVPPLPLQLWRGAYHAAVGDFDQARSLLRQAVDDWPLCSLAWALLAETHRLMDDRVETEGLFQEAARIKPDSVLPAERLFRLYARLDDPAKALKALEVGRSGSGQPNRVVASHLAYLTGERRLTDVLAERERCAATCPEDHANRRAIAMLRARRGERDEALALLRALAQEDVRSAANVLALAEQQARMGALDEGRRLMVSFLDGRGDDATAADWLCLARYCRAIGDADGATAAYRGAVSREKGLTRPASLALAGYHADAGMAVLALPLYRDLAADGGSPVAWRLYVETLARTGRVDEARRELEANAGRQADVTQNTLVRAKVAVAAGEVDEALATLDRFVARQPMEPAAYLYRAYAIYRSGAFFTDERGRNDLVSALDLAPGLGWPREVVACWAILMNQPANAIPHLELLLAAEPGGFASRALLARLYLATQQLQAMDALLKWVPSEPGDVVRWHRLRARLLLAKGQAREASRELADVFRQEPNAASLQDWAVALLESGRPDEALGELIRHERLVGTAPALLAMKGTTLAELGRSDEARRTFCAGLKLAGREQVAALFVAQQLCVAFGLKAALPLLAEAVPSGTLRGYLEGCCLMASGALAPGLDRLRRVRADLPEDSPLLTDVLHQLAHAYTLSGEHLQARPLYDILTAREPRRSTYYRKLGSMVESGKLFDIAADLGGGDRPPFTWESGDSLFQIIPGWLASFSGERVALFERVEVRFAEVWSTRSVPVASRCMAEVLASQDDLDRTLIRPVR